MADIQKISSSVYSRVSMNYKTERLLDYFNATKGFPCLLKSEDRATPHCLGKNKGRSHPYIDPMAVQRLRDFYRPFNQRFYQLAGMDFGWY
ncbi:heparan sulfate glucosamine 3-O-sulfotransferase 3B1 [Ooceraea biroi]|uniref:heparan sulfate glucosamine 3-O-sulfotransferase 3B1 n=1 Tax=Ooceraea biroi TaxID=2015173 RepID=UPI000F0971E9|nr:heparan sulfate glucosamine 3-O-sulfotransferase 3B1 [Ooceraea biroi]